MGMAIPDSHVQRDREQGCTLAESGDYEKAAACFRRAAAAAPPSAEVQEMLAQCLLETGAHEEALEAASAAARLRPQVKSLPQYHSQQFIRRLCLEAAKTFDCWPQWWTAHVTLGRAHRNSGDLQAALQALTTALDVGKDGMHTEDRAGVEDELEDTAALLQRQWATRVGLPQLRISQRVGEGGGPGCVVWECGLALAEYLSLHMGEAGLRGQRVLELGAGPGIAGVAAALRGARVTLTDRDAALLARNVDAHSRAISEAGGSAQAAVLEWERPDAELCRGPYDFLVGADLVYSEKWDAVEHLCAALGAVLGSSPRCRVLLAHCARHSSVDARLFSTLSGLGLRAAAVAASDKDKRVIVYACSRQCGG